MDEVLFRGSRKLENLQVQLEVASEQGKALLYHVSHQAKSVLLRIWNSSSFTHLQETVKQVAIYVLEIVNKVKHGVILHVTTIYGNVIKIIGLRWTRQNVYIGCTGFLLGSLLGFAIGMAMYKKQTHIRYMQAVQCLRYSGIEAVAVVEDAVAPYDCELNEVLVDVKAASVHIVDAKICTGYGRIIRSLMNKYNRFSKHDLPVTLGRSCAGIIIDIGKKVDHLEVGDEVWLTVPFWAPGTLSQSVLVHESKVSQKPKTIGYEAASSLPYAGTIALSALNQANLTANNCEDKRILILDGCTPVGCILIQILNLWKAHVTTTCFKRAVPVAQALGANDIVCLPEIENPEANFLPKIEYNLDKELTTRDKFDVILITGYECRNIKKFQCYCNVNGKVISTLPPILYSDSFGFSLGFLFGTFIRIKFFIQSLFGSEINYSEETHMCFMSLNRLKDLVENGNLQTVVDKVYHPSDIELALNHIQSPQSIGSTIITFR